MPLNPFFLQGSQSEQSLIQQIINEQLRMYGVEVIYIPRKYLNERSIIKENVLSEFDENYAIEAYVKSLRWIWWRWRCPGKIWYTGKG